MFKLASGLCKPWHHKCLIESIYASPHPQPSGTHSSLTFSKHCPKTSGEMTVLWKTINSFIRMIHLNHVTGPWNLRIKGAPGHQVPPPTLGWTFQAQGHLGAVFFIAGSFYFIVMLSLWEEIWGWNWSPWDSHSFVLVLFSKSKRMMLLAFVYKGFLNI